MPRLIKGSDLNAAQRAEVLRAFVYRWTVENGHRANVWGRSGLTPPAMPLQSDDEWLAEHAFHFLNDGSRLAGNIRFAEPSYLADDEGMAAND